MVGIRRNPFALLLLFGPMAALLGALLLYPFVNGIRLAFTDTSPMQRTVNWVGFENFEYVLDDAKFWESFYNSAVIIGAAVVVATVLGFAIALALNTGLRGRIAYRTAVFQVWIVPWIAVAILWGWMFNADYGVVNFLLRDLHIIDRNQNWLVDPFKAQMVIASAFAWRLIPFMMIVSLAALQSIPRELIEAARVDGASYARLVRSVIIPLVRGVLGVAALLQTVKLFQEITLPWMVTQGGPANATTTFSLYLYKTAFQQWDFGLAAAGGTLWLLFLVAFAAIYVRRVARAGMR
jgi:multiple sugar transport system permease protein